MEQISSKYVGNGRQKTTNRIENGNLLVWNAKSVLALNDYVSHWNGLEAFPTSVYQHQILHEARLSPLLNVFLWLILKRFSVWRCVGLAKYRRQLQSCSAFTQLMLIGHEPEVASRLDCNLRNKFKTILTLNSFVVTLVAILIPQQFYGVFTLPDTETDRDTNTNWLV